MLLSVLDTQSPAHLPVLVPELDRLGFHRYWATEHHSAHQSASPTIVAGLAAGISDRLRVGTAGVLLRATSALRVAQDFATLELFFPDRVDLGIAGALPGGAYADETQRDVPFASHDAYVKRVTRLVQLVRGAALPCAIGPQSVSRPQLWLCGTSARTAQLAGSLGIAFAYHHYLASTNQRVTAGIAEAYRGSFMSVDGEPPRLAIAAYGHCAESHDDALAEWNAFFGTDPPQPSFLGTPEVVATQLAELADGYTADELVIDSFAPSLERRIDALATIKGAVDRRLEATSLASDSLH